MLTMVKNHLDPANIKIMERSISSGNQVFLKAHEVRGTIYPAHAQILRDWENHLTETTPTNIDVIIYLRTKPEISWERLRGRNRSEEKNLTLDYVRILHVLYDQWLSRYEEAKVITINANQDIYSMMAELNAQLRQYQRDNHDQHHG